MINEIDDETIKKLKKILQSFDLRGTNNQVKCLHEFSQHKALSRRDLYQMLCPILHPNLTALLDRFEDHKLIEKQWVNAMPYYTLNIEIEE